jgi:hypothetical protein
VLLLLLITQVMKLGLQALIATFNIRPSTTAAAAVALTAFSSSSLVPCYS